MRIDQRNDFIRSLHAPGDSHILRVGKRRVLNQFEANRRFLQDIGTLLKHKIFLAGELGP
jgi:hypothetical protein